MEKRTRNMWISETGRDNEPVLPVVHEQLGHAMLEATAIDGQVQQPLDVEPDHQSPLAKSGQSLDEKVPRSWKNWE